VVCLHFSYEHRACTCSPHLSHSPLSQILLVILTLWCHVLISVTPLLYFCALSSAFASSNILCAFPPLCFLATPLSWRRVLILSATRTWRNRFVALSALSTRLRLLQNHPQNLLLLLQTCPAKHTDGASSGRLHSDDQVSPQNHQRLEN